MKTLLIPLACILTSFTASAEQNFDSLKEWTVYRGDSKGLQYSELAQITSENVSQLEPAWTYSAGDAKPRGSSMYSNPIIIDGRMYFTSPGLKAIAVDATTGKELWKFDPNSISGAPKMSSGRNRGNAYWAEGDDQRIFHFVKNRVYALNALTGKLITGFGEDGFIDLHENLRVDPKTASVEATTPGIVFENFLIVAGRVPEGLRSTPGDIRAYDTVTGELKWIFHTIPKPGEFGYDTWDWWEKQSYGGANPWGGFTLDAERGWVFCATGSPSYDFYGANRKGMNLFGNCVLALNARTGERVWHYQTVHHDIWDMDNPSAPILVTITHENEKRDAVVQLTKMGFIFVLDRTTGKPIFPVDEVPVPASKIPGEQAWPTQPIPRLPKSLSRTSITVDDLDNSTPERAAQARREFEKLLSTPLYTPPSLQRSLSAPGMLGGIEWHGASYEAKTNTLYVNSHDCPSVTQMAPEGGKPGKNATPLELGQHLYTRNCAACHGANREGVEGMFPLLTKLEKTDAEILKLFAEGLGNMPSFGHLPKKDQNALITFLRSEVPGIAASAKGENSGYVLSTNAYFKDKQGVPWVKPPWGKLSAVNLGTGEINWEVPLGEYPHLVKQGLRDTGSMNFGGAVATDGGIIFIAATADEKIRAFDKIDGKVLWEFKLPAGGYATPSTYSIDGRQYVVIACGGGGKNQTPTGDTVMAFALPDESPQANAQGWIELFDGKTLHGWEQHNGRHKYTVEDGAIIGRTVSGSPNSFLCTTRKFSDFELEVEVMIDDVTNSGIQFRSALRPETIGKKEFQQKGRVWGPQLEIRRNLGPGQPTTGVLYGEATGNGWISSKEKMETRHDFLDPNGWNKLRIVAKGPRLQTWVNGHPVEDLSDEEIYKQFPDGFIALQIHGIKNARIFTMGWRKIRIRELK